MVYAGRWPSLRVDMNFFSWWRRMLFYWGLLKNYSADKVIRINVVKIDFLERFLLL